MISYRVVPISSQKGVLFLRHPVYIEHFWTYHELSKLVLNFIALIVGTLHFSFPTPGLFIYQLTRYIYTHIFL